VVEFSFWNMKFEFQIFQNWTKRCIQYIFIIISSEAFRWKQANHTKISNVHVHPKFYNVLKQKKPWNSFLIWLFFVFFYFKLLCQINTSGRLLSFLLTKTKSNFLIFFLIFSSSACNRGKLGKQSWFQKILSSIFFIKSFSLSTQFKKNTVTS
jgi:hypothetical protein